jgi:3D (Asp-Asp-Asp) domain-containing protein
MPSCINLRGQVPEADSNRARILVYNENEKRLLVLQENTLRPVSELSVTTKEIKRINVFVTGYSSTHCQTDSTPFITAAGTSVREGIVATNLLAFGTEIRIPELYGDKIFVVEDRMHARNSQHVDVWFPTYWQAKNFGVTNTYIEVLNYN